MQKTEHRVTWKMKLEDEHIRVKYSEPYDAEIPDAIMNSTIFRSTLPKSFCKGSISAGYDDETKELTRMALSLTYRSRVDMCSSVIRLLGQWERRTTMRSRAGALYDHVMRPTMTTFS